MAGTQAITQDVGYPFALALDAARDLWTMAGVVTDEHESRLQAYTTGKVDWVGHHADTFAAKMRTAGDDAATIADRCKRLAGQLATQWSQARGEQDRRAKARWVDQQKDDDGVVENVVEFFTGEDDYGPPPGDPPAPSAPDFHATRSPWHPGCGW